MCKYRNSLYEARKKIVERTCICVVSSDLGEFARNKERGRLTIGDSLITTASSIFHAPSVGDSEFSETIRAGSEELRRRAKATLPEDVLGWER